VTLVAAASGLWSLTKLPIDAVPDVTNVQVQRERDSAGAHARRDREAGHRRAGDCACGIPGLESTRSFSRNGFAQITAVFADRTNIYFARQ